MDWNRSTINATEIVHTPKCGRPPDSKISPQRYASVERRTEGVYRETARVDSQTDWERFLVLWKRISRGLSDRSRPDGMPGAMSL